MWPNKILTSAMDKISYTVKNSRCPRCGAFDCEQTGSVKFDEAFPINNPISFEYICSECEWHWWENLPVLDLRS